MVTLRGFVIYLFVFLALGGGLLSPAIAEAQLIPCDGLDCKVDDLIVLAVRIYNFLLTLAGVVAVLIIVLAGIGMLTYHWFENPEQVLQGAKYTLSRAVAGLVIIATAFIVVQALLYILGFNRFVGVGLILNKFGL